MSDDRFDDRGGETGGGVDDELVARLRRYATQLDAGGTSSPPPAVAVARRPLLLAAAVVVAVVLAAGVALRLADGDPSVVEVADRVEDGASTVATSASSSPAPRPVVTVPTTTLPATPTGSAVGALSPVFPPSNPGAASTATAGSPDPTVVPVPAPQVVPTVTKPTVAPTTQAAPTSIADEAPDTPTPSPSTTVPPQPDGTVLEVLDERPPERPSRTVTLPQRAIAANELVGGVLAVVRTDRADVVELHVAGGNGCSGPVAYELTETASWMSVRVAVRVLTRERDDLACTMALQYFLVTVPLGAPLGDRVVVDVGRPR